ncbi:hypothetical protein ACHAPJ_000270 [Fusarium lateritium]
MSSGNLETTPDGLLICPVPENRFASFLSHALIKTHLELDSSLVPRLNIKIPVFENAGFAIGYKLKVWRPIDHAHGDYTDAEDHVLNWTGNLVNLSTKMTIHVHLCRPWRDFGLLSAAMAPPRRPGIALNVTMSSQNWAQNLDQYLAFHKAMTVRSIRRIVISS